MRAWYFANQACFASGTQPIGRYDEREVIGIVARGERLLPRAECGRPFPPDTRSWVLLLACMAGWRPSNPHPVLGTEVLWRAYIQLPAQVRITQAARAP